MNVTNLRVETRRLPLAAKPGKLSLTGPTPPRRAAPDQIDVFLVHLDTDAGVTGLGFAVTPGAAGKPGWPATLETLVHQEFAPILVGEPAHDVERLWAKAEAHCRGVGFAGPAARAYSAIDVALWDAKAKAAGVPLSTLWGSVRSEVGHFVSDAAGPHWDAADVAKLAKAAMKAGATGVRVETGTGDVQADADRVRELHDALGDEAWLGVAAGGRFDLATALALAHFFEDQGIDWLEDPLPLSDRAGYARLADRLELPVAVGSLSNSADELLTVIRDGLARVVRPDIGRLGGLTPVRRLATVAEACHIAVAPVRLPELAEVLARSHAAITLVDRVPWLDALLEATGGAGLGLGVRGASVE